jgi:triacylglycerol lipase
MGAGHGTKMGRVTVMSKKWNILMGLLLLSLLFIIAFSFTQHTMSKDVVKDTCETVILLHGQGRTRASMLLLKERLKTSGYETILYGYNVSSNTLDEITSALIRQIKEENTCPTYHLVGHSLGNIVVRNGFADRFAYPVGMGKIVMLAPPNKPAELAKQLRDNKIYHWLTGDSGQKLGDEQFYSTLHVPLVPFGVIAGTESYTGLPRGPSDGVVLVESTKLNGMADWVAVPRTHTYIMNGEDTFHHVVHFLKYGQF